MSEPKDKTVTATLFADEIVTSKNRIGDIEWLETLSSKIGLTQALLGASIFILFAAFYGFGASGEVPNWIGLGLTAIMGYILYRAFSDIQSYEKDIEYKIRILKDAKRKKQ